MTPACLIGSGPIAFDTINKWVSWTVTNIGADPVRMVRIQINWPGGVTPKPRLNNIQVDGINVWTGNPDTPPVEVCDASEGCAIQFNAGLPGDREFGPGETIEIKFIFSRVPPSGNYTLDATFLNITSGGRCIAANSATLP
jgi:hypothetical protein